MDFAPQAVPESKAEVVVGQVKRVSRRVEPASPAETPALPVPVRKSGRVWRIPGQVV